MFQSPLLSLAAAVLIAGDPSAQDHDLVIVVWGDAGWSDVVHQPHARTFEQFAQQGLSLSNWIGQPVGSMTVYTLLFGEYPMREGIHMGFSWEGDGSKYPDIRADKPCLFELLAQRGYATALVGKWGMGDTPFGTFVQDYRNVVPHMQGFGRWLAGIGSNIPSDGNYLDWDRVDDGVVTRDTTWADLAIGDAFVGWWTSTPSPKAAFVYFSAGHGPHGKVPPAEALPSGYVPPRFPSERQRYEAMLACIDEQTRRVLQVVDPQHTRVVVTCAAGTPDKAELTPTPGMVKRSTFDGGILLPTAVRGPGIPVGTSSALFSSTDLWAFLFPGSDPPADSRRGRDYTWARIQDDEAIRTRTHKLRRNVTTGEELLYELPDETLSFDPDSYRDQALVAKLRAWLANP